MPMSRRRAVAALACSAAAVAMSAAPTFADVVVGASGDYSSLKSHVGSGLEAHKYGKLSGPAITDAAFVNIEPTVSWSQVASGSQDSNIKRWADALKGKGSRLVSFSHEPMAKQNLHFGNASSFIAAFKHVENVFDSRGATNVRWVWNVTSNSFRVPSSRSEYGGKWYPGDAYVDAVAGEAYNRYKCGFSSPKSFADRIKEIFAFAQSHHKDMVVAEFASNAYSGRAQWIKDATSFVRAHAGSFAGAFYYNSSSHRAGGCRWTLNTSAEYSAVKAMVQL
jgi:beta-mannanase